MIEAFFTMGAFPFADDEDLGGAGLKLRRASVTGVVLRVEASSIMGQSVFRSLDEEFLNLNLMNLRNSWLYMQQGSYEDQVLFWTSF
jgi:hypothetical protein